MNIGSLSLNRIHNHGIDITNNRRVVFLNVTTLRELESGVRTVASFTKDVLVRNVHLAT